MGWLKRRWAEVKQELTDYSALCRFTESMKVKLKVSREKKGRAGWDNPCAVSEGDLARMLIEHVEKGDPVDIANFCMFLHIRDPENAAWFIRNAFAGRLKK